VCRLNLDYKVHENHIRRFRYGYRRSRLARSSRRRFQTALGLGDFHGKRLLDGRCGFGTARLLNARGTSSRYTAWTSSAHDRALRKALRWHRARFLIGDGSPS